MVCSSRVVLLHAKVSWIIVHMLSNWAVTVLKLCQGMSIYASHEGITFIQCPNVTRKSNGFVSIGIQKEKQSSLNEFTSLPYEIIEQKTFLCIIQGVVSLSGKLCYIFHHFRPPSVIESPLSLESCLKLVQWQSSNFLQTLLQKQPVHTLWFFNLFSLSKSNFRTFIVILDGVS